MDIIKDLFVTNKKVLKKTIKKMFNNPAIFLVGVPYLIIMYIGLKLASNMSIFGGIIIFLLESAVVSSYLYVINEIISNKIFELSDLKYSFSIYLRKIYVLLLILYLFNFGMSLFVFPLLSLIPFGKIILILCYFALFILFNPLLEIIYQFNLTEVDSLKFSINFVKNNFFSWLIPNVILIGTITVVVYYFTNLVLTIVNTPLYNVNFALKFVIFLILGQGFIGTIMIYRGELFDILSNTTRKKRLFNRLNDK
ncbi:hypothetical protein [Helicovermis profundi]|uniref:Uncharacterized protein n=1 Tax=Helicovermis profundi TaxID=3065157 RepID=A0AAU9E293_9FIRM|nr:hypothetical protein HLPR_09600 [Clostridia bacterium S502]